VTPFDDAVEEVLNKQQATREAKAKKMHAAQTGGGDIELGPSDIDQATLKQQGAMARQSDTQAAAQTQKAQAAQAPVNAPPAPTGSAGTTIPFPAQKGGGGPRRA
jgi:hypothetical protein